MPELLIDVDAIGRNTEAVATFLRAHGLSLVAVTKGCLGEPRVAAAMLAGGAVALADTRDLNLRRLREAFPRVELHRLDLPSPGRPFEPGDITYVSSREGAEAVAALGVRAGGPASGPSGPVRRVMVQVDTGDEREGVPLDRLRELTADIAADPRLRLAGIATNYACFRGTPAGIRSSVAAVAGAAAALVEAGLEVERVSGGNSSLLGPMHEGYRLPLEVTELRCGEALLLGHDALHYRPLPGCRQDACMIRAELVEEYTKSAPGGPGRRLLLAAGRQDLGRGVVEFREPGLREIGRSSDYLVAEASMGCPRLPIGTMIEMVPDYEALVAAWTSPYVERRFVDA